MTQMNKYMVSVTLSNKITGTSVVDVEILAYNKRQAERKGSNQVLNRSSRLLSSKAVAA